MMLKQLPFPTNVNALFISEKFSSNKSSFDLEEAQSLLVMSLFLKAFSFGNIIDFSLVCIKTNI